MCRLLGTRAGLNDREALGKVVTARPTKGLAQLCLVDQWFPTAPKSESMPSTCSRFNFAKAPVKGVKTDTIWQPTLHKRLGVTMYGGSYVVNVLKQKVVSPKTISLLPWRYTTAYLCHRLSNDLHFTNRPYTYVLRKNMSALSRRSKRTLFRKNVLNEIPGKSNLNHKKSFAMGALQKLHRLTVPWSSGQQCFACTIRSSTSQIIVTSAHYTVQ